MRSSIVLSVVCLCTALACTNAEPEPSTRETPPTTQSESEPESAGPPAGAWVVIDDRHGLFETANADPIPKEHDPNPSLRVAEVVAVTGDFVEVRTIASATAKACTGSLGIEPDVQLRFFVELDSLHPVLARPEQFEFDDGTKFELAAGVPVLETGPEGRILVGKTQLIVNLDEQDVGRWFPAPTGEPPATPALRAPRRDLHYGEHRFVAEWPPFETPFEEQEIEGGRLLTFADACGRFVLRTRPERNDGVYAMKGPKDAMPRTARNFDPDLVARNAGILGVVHRQSGEFLEPPAWGVGDFEDCTPTKWNAPAGTALTWLRGGEAGVVLAAHELPANAEERGDRLCYWASELPVCIETAKLEREGNECSPASDSETPVNVRLNAKGAKVSAGLDPDIVRRIVRAHVNEVRTCYRAGLVEQPALAGRVEIAFSIDAKGKVAIAGVHATTLEPADERVANCIAKAVKRWTFPKPMSGATVSVVFPFEMSPG